MAYKKYTIITMIYASEPKFGHEAVIPPRRVTGVPLLPTVWSERFSQFSSCDVGDVVGPLYTMAGGIRPLWEPVPRVVGRALTVKAWPGDNLAIHGALALAAEGDVLVVDWRGELDACGAGAQVLADPFSRGLRAVVIDGAWRDVDDLREHRMPVFAKGVAAYSPPKRHPGEVNVPVACGGVVVEAGDLVVADADGVAVVPRRYLELVWEQVRQTAAWIVDAEARETKASRRAAVYEHHFKLTGGTAEQWPE
jgi:4-hydroxy-4-methyl-2-oxoglutarate aldolase